MKTSMAFLRGQASRGKKFMVFDWDKAARLIRERKPAVAGAGLCDDWEWTGGTIYANGAPVVNSYTYLGSTWAVPELDMDGDVVPCWRYAEDTPEWSESTKWPESALAILQQETT